MAVSIRLRRMGANNDIFYRVVAADSRSPRDGRFLEVLGWYNPKKPGNNYELKMDRIKEWAGKGARVSFTVASLMRKATAAAK